MRYCWMLALTARAARGLARTSATTSATAPNKVVFVGAGSFGSAMALVAARAQPDASIKIWARRDAVVDEIYEQRRNGRYLPEDQDPFPSNVEATKDLSGAVADANIVVLAVPGEFLGTTLEQIDLDGKVAISLVKSARQTKGDVATVCEDVEARFKTCRACALSGPNIYGSLARGEFAEATVGALDADTAAEAARVFASPAFRVDTVEDRAGVELCGVLKNVVALGSGFADAVAGPNARAALIRAGLVEIHALASRLRDAERATFFESPCGLGDLVLTTSSGRGRVLAKAFANDSVDEPADAKWARLEAELFDGMKLPDWHAAQLVGDLLDERGWRGAFPLLASINDVAWRGAQPAAVVDALRPQPAFSR